MDSVFSTTDKNGNEIWWKKSVKGKMKRISKPKDSSSPKITTKKAAPTKTKKETATSSTAKVDATLSGSFFKVSIQTGFDTDDKYYNYLIQAKDRKDAVMKVLRCYVHDIVGNDYSEELFTQFMKTIGRVKIPKSGQPPEQAEDYVFEYEGGTVDFNRIMSVEKEEIDFQKGYFLGVDTE